MKNYSRTKSALLILMSLLLSTYGVTANSEQEKANRSLPLECSKIPDKNTHLCFIQTQSPYGPYDDVVFYRMDKSGDVTLLGSQSGGVATFGGVDFSTRGAYMWLSWAEEGHPHFEFYRTRDFIDTGLSANIIKVLGDYYFDGFEKFSDAGEVVYRLADGAYEDCDRAVENFSYEIDPKTSEKRCVKKFSLPH